MNLTCNKCGRVAFGVTREHAENEVINFNKYFNSLTEKEKQDYYHNRPATISLYEICTQCGNSYKDFRDYKPGDCPNGVTISPIIEENNETK